MNEENAPYIHTLCVNEDCNLPMPFKHDNVNSTRAYTHTYL